MLCTVATFITRATPLFCLINVIYIYIYVKVYNDRGEGGGGNFTHDDWNTGYRCRFKSDWKRYLEGFVFWIYKFNSGTIEPTVKGGNFYCLLGPVSVTGPA